MARHQNNDEENKMSHRVDEFHDPSVLEGGVSVGAVVLVGILLIFFCIAMYNKP